MEKTNKVLTIGAVGILTWLGYNYFKNQQGTDELNTMGSVPVYGYGQPAIYSYSFSDLFGSGQTSPSTSEFGLSPSSTTQGGFLISAETGEAIGTSATGQNQLVSRPSSRSSSTASKIKASQDAFTNLTINKLSPSSGYVGQSTPFGTRLVKVGSA